MTWTQIPLVRDDNIVSDVVSANDRRPDLQIGVERHVLVRKPQPVGHTLLLVWHRRFGRFGEQGTRYYKQSELRVETRDGNGRVADVYKVLDRGTALTLDLIRRHAVEINRNFDGPVTEQIALDHTLIWAD